MTISWEKHREVALEWGISDVDAYAMARTEKECYDAFQSLEYEVNTLHTANGQTRSSPSALASATAGSHA